MSPIVLSQTDSTNENNQVGKIILSYPPKNYLSTKRCYRESLQELPCVIKYNQLYCTSPGSSYPATSIKHFVEDNRALLRSARHWLLRVT